MTNETFTHENNDDATLVEIVGRVIKVAFDINDDEVPDFVIKEIGIVEGKTGKAIFPDAPPLEKQ